METVTGHLVMIDNWVKMGTLTLCRPSSNEHVVIPWYTVKDVKGSHPRH